MIGTAAAAAASTAEIWAPVLAAGIQTIGNFALARMQHNDAVDMMDKQNEYNSPENQIKRLQAAGISPNQVAMGNGSIVGNNTSAPYTGYQRADIGNLAGSISESALNLAKTKTENARRAVDIESTQASIDNLIANTQKLGLENEYQDIVNKYAEAMQKSALSESTSREKLNYYQIGKVKAETKSLISKLPHEVQSIIIENNLNAFRIDEVIAQIANIEADTSLIETQKGLVTEQTELTEAQTEGKKFENRVAPEMAIEYKNQIVQTVAKLKAETNKTEEEIFYMLYDAYDKYLSPYILGFKVPANLVGWHANEMEIDINRRYGNRFNRQRSGASSTVNGR